MSTKPSTSNKLAYLFLAVLGVALEGLVIANLWKWFVTPLGVSAITVPHAIGLLLITQMLIGKKLIDTSAGTSMDTGVLWEHILGACVWLIMAWVVHLVL